MQAKRRRELLVVPMASAERTGHFTPKEKAHIGKRASEHCSHSSPMAVNLALLDSVKGSSYNIMNTMHCGFYEHAQITAFSHSVSHVSMI